VHIAVWQALLPLPACRGKRLADLRLCGQLRVRAAGRKASGDGSMVPGWGSVVVAEGAIRHKTGTSGLEAMCEYKTLSQLEIQC